MCTMCARPSGEQVTERESFAFRMYDTSESSADEVAIMLEGVLDPAAGNGTATRTATSVSESEW